MAEANPDTSPPESDSTPKKVDESKEESSSLFECNICFDTAQNAVVSKCGHLYCWACIFRWMNHRPLNPTCPVCKGAISKDTLTPIYGKSGSQEDPRDKAPPRPQGQRQEPPPQNNFFGAPFGNELTFQIGIGAFPFGLFTNAFNYPGQNRQQPQNPEVAEERKLSRYFIYIALVFIIWVLY